MAHLVVTEAVALHDDSRKAPQADVGPVDPVHENDGVSRHLSNKCVTTRHWTASPPQSVLYHTNGGCYSEKLYAKLAFNLNRGPFMDYSPP